MIGRRLIALPKPPCANCETCCGYVRSGEAGFDVLCKRCPGRPALLPPSHLPPRVVRMNGRIVTTASTPVALSGWGNVTRKGRRTRGKRGKK
jgi:hypothetical protein